MKSFVLLSNRTGNICEGYRISFFDKQELSWSEDLLENHPYRISLGILGHDGWIVCSTEAGGFKTFMNNYEQCLGAKRV